MATKGGKMKTVYFAHPLSHYDEDIEYKCMEIIMTSFMNDEDEEQLYIFNPNDPVIDRLYKKRREDSHGPDPFSIFTELARACDYIVGACFTDGAIGYGVATELQVQIDDGKQVYLIFFDDEFEGQKRFIMPVSSLSSFRVLNREETHQRNADGFI